MSQCDERQEIDGKMEPSESRELVCAHKYS